MNSHLDKIVEADLEALLAEARDPATSWKRLEELLLHLEPDARQTLLDNPQVCPTNDQGKLKTSLLESLAEAFPEEVAAHPLFVLHVLIEPNEEFEVVVKEVVKRTKDAGLIERVLSIWGPSSVYVRLVVASNPRTPEDLLRTLGNPETESDEDVRKEVAENPSTPVDTLRTLGNPKTESHGWVRKAVVENPNTPVDLLRTLANSSTESNRWVREVAQKTLAYRGLA